MNGEARLAMIRRHMAGDWTPEEVLFVARHRDFTVHKYRDKHIKLRKVTRRMCKDGLLQLVESDGTHFHYRARHGSST